MIIKYLSSLLIVVHSIFFIGCSDYSEDSLSCKIFNNTPCEELILSVKKEDIHSISKIIQNSPELLNYKEELYDENVLYWAVANRKFKSTEILLQLGADPNEICYKSGGAALSAAIEYTENTDKSKKLSTEMIKLLLEHGADPNLHLTYGYEEEDYLSLATYYNNLSAVKLLVENGADINYRQNKINRALSAVEYALSSGQLDIAEYLIVEKHADCLALYEIDDPKLKVKSKDYSISFLVQWWTRWDKTAYSETDRQTVIKILNEIKQQCNNSNDIDAVNYTLESMKKFFSEFM